MSVPGERLEPGFDSSTAETQMVDLFNDIIPVAAARAPLGVQEVVLDPVFGRRRDALLRTIPIHDLVDRAERSDSGISGFDVRALALAAFDAVIARQGFPNRTTPAQVIDLLASIGAIQSPHAAAETCAVAAEYVLSGLTNRRERERQFAPTVAQGLPPIRPAAPLYQALLNGGLRQSGKKALDETMAWTATAWLDDGLRSAAAAVLAAGNRIAQESVGYETLARCPIWW
jgi:hypothetical protein